MNELYIDMISVLDPVYRLYSKSEMWNCFISNYARSLVGWDEESILLEMIFEGM